MSILAFLIGAQESMKAENKFLSSHSPITCAQSSLLPFVVCDAFLQLCC
jgi:hypothetical protein